MNRFDVVDLSEIPPPMTGRRSHKPGKWQLLLAEFVASGYAAVRVNLNGSKRDSVVSRLSPLAKSYPVKVMQRGDEVYLVRTEVDQ